MADIKDFFSGSGNQTTASMAYLLLMANVLGLAIFIDGKKGIHSSVKEPSNKDNPIKQSMKPVLTTCNKGITDIADEIEQTLDENIEDKPKKNDAVFEQIEQTAKQNSEEMPRKRDNIIDFKEAVALRTQETKPPLKPLIWKFPEK